MSGGPLGRLECYCVGQTHAKELDEFLTRATEMCEKKSYREAFALMQQQVRLLREEYKKHKEGEETFKRSMMELAKYGQTEPTVVLRTTREKKLSGPGTGTKKKRKMGK